MNLLLENPLPIWSIGAVCLAIGVVIFLAKRSLASVIGIAGVLVATVLMLIVERTVVTPSEEVEQSLVSLMAAIEANDLARVVSFIDSAAKHVRSDAETLMPQVKIKETGATSVRVEVDENAYPRRATVYFRGRVEGTHARSGARIFYFDQVEIDWQKSADQWLIVDYRVMFRGKPINAVDGFRQVR